MGIHINHEQFFCPCCCFHIYASSYIYHEMWLPETVPFLYIPKYIETKTIDRREFLHLGSDGFVFYSPIFYILLERWVSGLNQRTANASTFNRVRGFESLPLRSVGGLKPCMSAAQTINVESRGAGLVLTHKEGYTLHKLIFG